MLLFFLSSRKPSGEFGKEQRTYIFYKLSILYQWEFSIVLFNMRPAGLFTFTFRMFLVHCSHSAPHWDNLEGHYVLLHEEQIIFLQTMASLISIKKRNMKENKSSTGAWARISLLLHAAENKVWYKRRNSTLEVKKMCQAFLILKLYIKTSKKGRVESPQNTPNFSWHHWTVLILGRHPLSEKIWSREKVFHRGSARSFQKQNKKSTRKKKNKQIKNSQTSLFLF